MAISVLDFSLRIVAAAAAVGLVLVVLRVRSGAARHAAWSAVLAAMLLMPGLTAIVPRVDVPVPSALALDFAAIPHEVPPDGFALAITPGSPASVMPAPVVVPAGIDRSRQPTAWDFGSASRLTSLIFLVYCIGVVVFAVRLAGGWRMARRLVAGATPVALENPSPVLESGAVATPLTTGIFSPRVLLPLAWREWPGDKLSVILAHENAHIARRDALVAFVAQLNRAIFWFHPLSWWLERTLAVTSEHACDEAAARHAGHPRRYAEVLLDMAEAVSLTGRRVSWQTIGVDGSGLLGARIDRILKGDAMARMSGARRVGVAAGCAAVLVLAIACRQQITAEPLKPDPAVQKQIDDNHARAERHKAAVAMTPAEAAALEKSLEADPNNVEAREKLIIFYDQSGKVSWEEKLTGMRRHGLWRLANLPETDLWIPNISKRYDPEGYAEATRLWRQQTSTPDVSAKTLGRAAAFFSAYDKEDAEELLLRAQRMDPDGRWAERLGDLYARAIVGSIDPRYGTRDEREAQSAFAAAARRSLQGSTDARVLTEAGHVLAMQYARAGEVEFGRRLLERAAALDPQNGRAQRILTDLRDYDRRGAIQARIVSAAGGEKFDPLSDAAYAAVTALPEDDRLFYLPGAAESAFMSAEYTDYTARQKPEPTASEQKARAAAGFARARQYAEDALALAERHPQSEEFGDVLYRANTTLGLLALRDGDRLAAVRHTQAAADAPAPPSGSYTPEFTLRARLVEYLLRAGERESVAAYVEKSAERFPAAQRTTLLADAKRIRAGVMPQAYQYAEARR